MARVLAVLTMVLWGGAAIAEVEGAEEGFKIWGLSIIVFGILALAYFFPSFVAGIRQHHQVWPIILVNLFFAWTVVGWIFALVWAVSSQRPGSSTTVNVVDVERGKQETV